MEYQLYPFVSDPFSSLLSSDKDKDPLPNARYVQYLSTCTPDACLLNILIWAFICGREKKILCDGVACNREFFVFWSFLKTFFTNNPLTKYFLKIDQTLGRVSTSRRG